MRLISKGSSESWGGEKITGWNGAAVGACWGWVWGRGGVDMDGDDDKDVASGGWDQLVVWKLGLGLGEWLFWPF